LTKLFRYVTVAFGLDDNVKEKWSLIEDATFCSKKLVDFLEHSKDLDFEGSSLWDAK